MKVKLRYYENGHKHFPANGTGTGWPSSYIGSYVARPLALMRDRRKVNNPAWDAANYFRTRLKARGIPVRNKVESASAVSATESLATFSEHDVNAALWQMLRYSDNTVAEVMIRHVALARGESTSTTGAPASVRAELKTLSIPMGRAAFHDGSGLSRSDKLPAKTLAAIVRASADPNRPDLSSPYREWSVPIAGWTGTLSSRFGSRRTKCAQGLVMAKTGTLSNVISLSGIAAGNDGTHRAFAIHVNNKPSRYSSSATREHVDRIAAAITGCK